MYEKVSYKNGTEIIIPLYDAGGLKEVIASIKEKIYYHLNMKVRGTSSWFVIQRHGRAHTSAATVAVLPEAEEVSAKLRIKI